MNPKKKVLIITYYWPPSGGSGVQRWVKFAKYLPEFDIEPIILTVKNGTYPLIDKSLNNDLKSNLKVFYSKAYEPYSLFGLFSGKSASQVSTPSSAFTQDGSIIKRIGIWIRANFFIPDARIGWNPFAYTKAKQIIKEFNIETVITTGPPNSTHLIGSKLKSKSQGIRWIMDMRDPWSKIFFNETLPRSKFASTIDTKLEEKALKNADEVLLVSKSMIQIQKSIIDRSYLVINNGFDHQEFPPLDNSKKDDKFTIKYIGSMTESAIPYNLFKALQSLDSDYYQKIKLIFIGSINRKVVEIIKAQGLYDIVEFKEYLPHLEAKKEMQNSDLLLLVIPSTKDNELIITGKIYDYIGAQKPIICIGPENGDAANLISEYQLGYNFGYDDIKLITAKIEGLISFNDKTYMKWGTDLKAHPFSRFTLTKKLSKTILNENI